MRKKRIPAVICICLLSILAFTGCGRNEENPDFTGKLDDIRESVSETETPEQTEPAAEVPEEPSAEETQEAPEAGESQNGFDMKAFSEAFSKGQIDDNGSYFVKVGDKVYFRKISPDAMDEGAIFGEFLNTEYTPVPCPLICYDLNTCEWEEVGTITGIGKLYACEKGFYIGDMNPNSLDSYCINLYDPVSEETTFYCKGTPHGISYDGELLAVEQYGGQNINTVLIRDGEAIVTLGGEEIYYEFCGFSGRDMIVLLHTADQEYILCSVTESGEITELGKLNGPETGYPELKQFRCFNDEVYLCYGYFEGTGHFLSGWEVVKAAPGVKGSLEKVLDHDASADEGEGPENEVPLFYFEPEGEIDTYYSLPYQAYMGRHRMDCDNVYYLDDIYEEQLLAVDFIRNDFSDGSQVIQDMPTIDETVFVIYADVEYDPSYDIGWRMGYRRTGWHICAIPFGYGHLDEEGLAKQIIYFN